MLKSSPARVFITAFEKTLRKYEVQWFVELRTDLYNMGGETLLRAAHNVTWNLPRLIQVFLHVPKAPTQIPPNPKAPGVHRSAVTSSHVLNFGPRSLHGDAGCCSKTGPKGHIFDRTPCSEAPSHSFSPSPSHSLDRLGQ